MNKTKWVDYKQIKERASFAELVKHYGLELKAKDDELIGVCPLPEHGGDRDNSNAFHISLDKNCYHCLTHCGGGNIVDFVRLMEKLPENKESFRQAALLLQEKFLPQAEEKKTEDKKQEPSPTTEEKPTDNEPLSFSLEKKVKYDHPYLIEEKQFPLELVKKYGVGWCKTGLMAGRVVFPIHNVRGELVAYAGRALTEKDEQQRGKYLFPSGFNKSLELWNFHRVKDKNKLVRDFGLIVVEGFTDALRLIQYGFENVVALMGWSMSPEQNKSIFSITDKICLFLDHDKTGIEATKKIHKELIHQLFIKVAFYPEDPTKTQPEHFNKQELVQILSGKHANKETNNGQDDNISKT